jgi:hypothetical protein
LFSQQPISQASAASPNKTILPLEGPNGATVGKVTLTTKNKILYADYDFDCPSNCHLKSITTVINNKKYTHFVDSPDGQTLHQYPDTYITSRDAVLAFDTRANSDYSQTFRSVQEFDCSDNSLNSGYINDYSNRNYLPQPTPSTKYSYSEWLKEWSKHNNISQPTPTVRYSYDEWSKTGLLKTATVQKTPNLKTIYHTSNFATHIQSTCDSVGVKTHDCPPRRKSRPLDS